MAACSEFRPLKRWPCRWTPSSFSESVFGSRPESSNIPCVESSRQPERSPSVPAISKGRRFSDQNSIRFLCRYSWIGESCIQRLHPAHFQAGPFPISLRGKSQAAAADRSSHQVRACRRSHAQWIELAKNCHDCQYAFVDSREMRIALSTVRRGSMREGIFHRLRNLSLVECVHRQDRKSVV